MIRVTIYKNEKHQCVGFKAHGHAGFSEEGQDIVCAAVSVLTINTLNAIEKFADDRTSLVSDESKGLIDYRLKGNPTREAKLLLDAVVATEAEEGRGEYHPVYGREGMVGKRDPREVGMHSLRGGTVAGVHTVSFFGTDEEVSLTHRATSRQIFVNGALAAACKMAGREPGFYGFDEVMFN